MEGEPALDASYGSLAAVTQSGFLERSAMLSGADPGHSLGDLVELAASSMGFELE